MRFTSRAVFAGSLMLASSIPVLATPLPPERAPQARQSVKPHATKPMKPAAAKQKPFARKPDAARAALASVPPAHRELKKPLFGWPKLVDEARKYMGTNPTKRSRLWCATFMNMVLAKAGYNGTNSDAAKSFASYGRRVYEPQVGAIAVLTRGKRGGHVGVVSGVDPHGNPIIISGNHNKVVGEATYSRSRVIAYVMPADGPPAPGATRVAERGAPNVSRAGSEPAIDSPIAELMAAIEKERAERLRAAPAIARPQPVARVAQAQPRPDTAPRPPRTVEQLSAVPRRVVQQTAEEPRLRR
jgi:uncharacterized protein (TIGR02594 family)